MKCKEEDLVKEIFYSQNIPQESVVIVHSAFRQLSLQNYVAENFIESMMRECINGALLMPAMTWKTVTPQNPIFDELNTASHTGILSEIFRNSYATSRSLHPTHSVAGFGKYAKNLLGSHHHGSTPTPLSSPYGLMRNYDSYVLLLGVGINVCTAIHHPEEIIAPDLYLNPINDIESYTLIDRNKKEYVYKLRKHSKLAKNTSYFEKIIPLLDKNSSTTGNIGNVNWRLISIKELMKISFDNLSANKLFFLEN